jgi:hypothetical protein
VPGLFQDGRPFAGEWAGGMAVALAQQRAGHPAESEQAEPAPVAVQMRTVLMFAENASRGLALVAIRRGILHDRHCTAVAEASAMTTRVVHQGGPGSLRRRAARSLCTHLASRVPHSSPVLLIGAGVLPGKISVKGGACAIAVAMPRS